MDNRQPVTRIFPLVVLYVIGFLGFFSQSLLYPVMPLYAAGLGAGVAEVGPVVAIYSLGTVLGMIPVGMLSDRHGRRRFLVAGLIIYTIIPFLYPVTQTIFGLMVMRAVHGFGQALFITTVLATVTDLAHPMRRGIAIGWYTTATQSGLTLGPPLGGAVMSIFGYQAAFLASSIASVAGLIFVLFHFRAWPVGEASGKAQAGREWGWLNNRVVVAALLTSLFMAVGVGTMNTYIPLYALNHGINEMGAGIIMMCMFLTSALGRAPAGKVSDRIGRQPIILWGSVICVVFTGLIAVFHSIVPLCAVGLLFGAGMGIAVAASMALSADNAPPHLRGLAMSFYATFFQGGSVIGPTTLGLVAGASNMEVMFIVCAIVMACGLAAACIFLGGAKGASRQE